MHSIILQVGENFLVEMSFKMNNEYLSSFFVFVVQSCVQNVMAEEGFCSTKFNRGIKGGFCLCWVI